MKPKRAGRPKKKDNSVIIFTKKSIGAVHISNDLSLFERKIMNILIRHAQEIERYQTDERPFADEKGNRFWKIDFETVEKMLNIEKYHQRKDISEALERLVETSLKFNILKKDNTSSDWNVKTSLLAEVRYKDIQNNKFLNEIYYYFSPTIRTSLINPKLYTPITLSLQKEFKSKHSLALWEYLNSELSIRSTDETTTKPIPINDYVYLVAGSNVEYKKFFETNRTLIKKPLEEVNTKSDLTAEAVTHKRGRKVVAISHHIQRKKEYAAPLFDSNLNPGIQSPCVVTEELSFEYAVPTNVAANGDAAMRASVVGDPKSIAAVVSLPSTALNEKLINLKISEKKRKEFLEKFSLNHILENIKEADSWAEGRKTKPSAPVYIKAIEENWANAGEEKERLKKKEVLANEILAVLCLPSGERRGAVVIGKHKYIKDVIASHKKVLELNEDDWLHEPMFALIRPKYASLDAFKAESARYTKEQLDILKQNIEKLERECGISVEEILKSYGPRRENMIRMINEILLDNCTGNLYN